MTDENLSASTVFDANDKQGALPPAIHRLHGEGTVSGPVVTAACADESVVAVLHALESAPSGCVVVVQGSGEWAYVGELLCTEAARIGAVAVVVDGYARDIDQVRALPLVLFARGLTPRGARFGDAGEVGVPLRLGDTEVRPGDWAVADDDGVTVVRAEDAPRVRARAAEIARHEAGLAEGMRGGRPLRDLLT